MWWWQFIVMFIWEQPPLLNHIEWFLSGEACNSTKWGPASTESTKDWGCRHSCHHHCHQNRQKKTGTIFIHYVGNWNRDENCWRHFNFLQKKTRPSSGILTSEAFFRAIECTFSHLSWFLVLSCSHELYHPGTQCINIHGTTAEYNWHNCGTGVSLCVGHSVSLWRCLDFPTFRFSGRSDFQQQAQTVERPQRGK